MQSFKASFTNELEKIWKRKKFVAAAIISLFTIVLGQIIVVLIRKFSGINLAGGANFPLLVLSIFSHTFIPLFGIFVAADLFSGEISSNTLKLSLSRPVSRFKIFSSKVSALGVFVLFHLFFSMLTALISTVIVSGMNIDFLTIIVAYLVSFFPVFIFVLVAVLLSNLLKSPTSVFMLSIVSFLVLWALGILFSSYSSFFIIPLFNWYTFFTGSFVNLAKVVRTIIIILSMGGLLFSAGYFIFEKRSV